MPNGGRNFHRLHRSIRRYLLLFRGVRDRPLPRSRDPDLGLGFSLGLAVTGLVLGYCSGNSALAVSQKALQYCLVIHFACAGLMVIFLPVHIYMAALAPGEGPALCSMLTGLVPLKHVCEHNPLWYAELKQSGKMVQTDTNTR